MDRLIRGTTPTIRFEFKTISPNEIVTAYLVIKQLNRAVIEQDLSKADIDETALEWTLAQKETLKLDEKYTAVLYCDWVTENGTRGRSVLYECTVEQSGKNKVI